jgi:hypothetical protein
MKFPQSVSSSGRDIAVAINRPALPPLRLVSTDQAASDRWRMDVENAALVRGVPARINGEVIPPQSKQAYKLKRKLSSAQRQRAYRLLAGQRAKSALLCS